MNLKIFNKDGLLRGLAVPMLLPMVVFVIVFASASIIGKAVFAAEETTTVVETTTTVPTTVAKTTTVVPTTVAETTTVVPTTVAETTTVVPTTVAETTTVVPTTVAEVATEEPTVAETSEENQEDFYWDGPVLNAYNGTVQGPSGKETYYNLNMSGVISIMRSIGNYDEYWVRDDGCKMLGNYIMVAADLDIRPRGTIIPTSLGMGIVCDTGTFIYENRYQVDIAVTW